MVKKFDFLVIGSGLAGMSFALKVAHKGKVALICKAGLEEANTYFAQGGIASVTNLKVDNFEKHIEDTMIAGDWISDRAQRDHLLPYPYQDRYRHASPRVSTGGCPGDL